jgi:hypothetical protein
MNSPILPGSRVTKSALRLLVGLGEQSHQTRPPVAAAIKEQVFGHAARSVGADDGGTERERGEDEGADAGEEGGDEAPEHLAVGEGAAAGGERLRVSRAEHVEEAPGSEQRHERGEREGVREEGRDEGQRDGGSVVDAEVGEGREKMSLRSASAALLPLPPTIDVQKARGPLARHEARVFSTTRARHGTSYSRPGLDSHLGPLG